MFETQKINMNSSRIKALLTSCIVFATILTKAQSGDSSKPEPKPDTKSALQEAAKSSEVAAELDEPDGASIEMLPDGGWRIFGKGTGTYDFNDADDIRQATQDAQLRAKANIAKFLNERITSDEYLNNLTKKVKNLSDDGSGKQTGNITKTDIQTRAETIRNSASQILKGIIVLESKKEPRGNGGTVEVKVGVSSKTVAVADRASSRLQKNGEAPGGGESTTGQGGFLQGANQAEQRKSKSDF